MFRVEFIINQMLERINVAEIITTKNAIIDPKHIKEIDVTKTSSNI